MYICIYTRSHVYIYIYIYRYYSVQLNTELGVIPSGQENHSGAEHLNFPGGELNVIFYRAIYIKKKLISG